MCWQQHVEDLQEEFTRAFCTNCRIIVRCGRRALLLLHLHDHETLKTRTPGVAID
jgi:hypothetical protein